MPSFDLVIYKMGDNNGQYDPTLTDVPQPEPSHERDDWKPVQGTPFVEGSRRGDDGIRHVLQMVCAAVVPADEMDFLLSLSDLSSGGYSWVSERPN